VSLPTLVKYLTVFHNACQTLHQRARKTVS
jgi:hypothetical protein